MAGSGCDVCARVPWLQQPDGTRPFAFSGQKRPNNRREGVASRSVYRRLVWSQVLVGYLWD